VSLTATRESDQAKVIARDAEKSDGPYRCRGCNEVLTLKKGNIKVHHFAHKPPVTCSWGAGETAQHLQAKMAIYDALKSDPNVSAVTVEEPLGGLAVADVYAVISGYPVAIEVQRSKLTQAHIAHRSANYHRMGIHVLWLALQSDGLNTAKYSPSAWEKWCHYAYFGRVYYWSSGQTVIPYHLGEHMLHVPMSTWYESGGYENSAGGYDKPSRRWRTPLAGVPVLIGSHFRPKRRTASRSKTIDVPECSLYSDGQPVWWERRPRVTNAGQ